MLRILLFITCFVVVCYGLFRPEVPPAIFRGADRVMHFSAFLGVSFSARLAFPKLPAWLVWGLLLAFAPISEWLQSVIQPVNRSFNWLDIVANTMGVLTALLCYVIYVKWLHPRLFNQDHGH
ncbi:VanZ family protein [Thiopseudomonas alkaliphila]|uniref:VanZ family protein n=1 Tax=Thiopseudomonas alkaliphila TaxID=1697053 RepID=A0AAW7DTJ4_9GAMM|nr:VanZ family protein [Thiopseudomonas alkaliphila]MDM1696962.1 VanZ family protein [Thiopseudomonas alkaliphila]